MAVERALRSRLARPSSAAFVEFHNRLFYRGIRVVVGLSQLRRFLRLRGTQFAAQAASDENRACGQRTVSLH